MRNAVPVSVPGGGRGYMMGNLVVRGSSHIGVDAFAVLLFVLIVVLRFGGRGGVLVLSFREGKGSSLQAASCRGRAWTLQRSLLAAGEVSTSSWEEMQQQCVRAVCGVRLSSLVVCGELS